MLGSNAFVNMSPHACVYKAHTGEPRRSSSSPPLNNASTSSFSQNSVYSQNNDEADRLPNACTHNAPVCRGATTKAPQLLCVLQQHRLSQCS